MGLLNVTLERAIHVLVPGLGHDDLTCNLEQHTVK